MKQMATCKIKLSNMIEENKKHQCLQKGMKSISPGSEAEDKRFQAVSQKIKNTFKIT